MTPFGCVVFVSVNDRIHAKPKNDVLVSSEQALCDFVYLLRREGVNPSAVVSFCGLHKLSEPHLDLLLKRYPSTVRLIVRRLLSECGAVLKA